MTLNDLGPTLNVTKNVYLMGRVLLTPHVPKLL